MDQDLIVVKQLPVIEDQLIAVKESIETRVKEATSLICTEENYKDVKKVRADLSKEYQEMETRRKAVKAAIIAPYDQFEKIYKDCVGDAYTAADKVLKNKITEVEDGLKSQKNDALQEYFAEYRESVGIAPDFVCLSNMGIRIGLSDSLSGLKKRVAEYLDRIASDLKAIEGNADRDEILVEYKKDFNLATAIATVNNRHQQMEAARKAREEEENRKRMEAAKAAEILAAAKETAWEAAQEAQDVPLAAPVVMDAPQEGKRVEEAPEVYTTTFTVTGTLEQLKALKKFLTEGGYEYV